MDIRNRMGWEMIGDLLMCAIVIGVIVVPMLRYVWAVEAT